MSRLIKSDFLDIFLIIAAFIFFITLPLVGGAYITSIIKSPFSRWLVVMGLLLFFFCCVPFGILLVENEWRLKSAWEEMMGIIMGILIAWAILAAIITIYTYG